MGDPGSAQHLPAAAVANGECSISNAEWKQAILHSIFCILHLLLDLPSDFPRRRQRVLQFRRVFSAGLGVLRASPTAAASHLGGVANPVAGFEAELDHVIADNRDEADLS